MMIPATYYKAGNSFARAVTLEFSESALCIVDLNNDNNLRQTFALNDIKRQPSLATLPQEIALPNGDQLVVESQYPLENYITVNHGIVYSMEKHRSLWVIALLLIPLCLYGIIAKLIPAAAQSIVPLIPQVVLEQVDKQVITVIDSTLASPSELEADVIESVSMQWQALDKELTIDLKEYSLNFRKSKAYGANAFALPGGTIVLTDDLVNLFKNDPQALTAVLLHEIGHVEYQHGVQLMMESIGTTLLMTYFLGDMEGIAEIFSGTALSVIQNQFSQKFEQQADSFSVKYLNELGIPENKLAVALKGLIGNQPNLGVFEQYFSSHPSLEERTKAISPPDE